MACVASSSWTHSLPYTPSTPLRPTTATWNTKFPAGLSLDLDLPYAAPVKQQRPTLRLQALSRESSHALPSRRFDPFADEPVASTSQLQSQNTPPPRGRPLTPLIVPSTPAPSTPVVGRRRAPSFSAGSPRSAVRPSSPAPIVLQTAVPAAMVVQPTVRGAPSPFHARHYSTPDARARLLARTLLNRIHAVGRPRSLYSSSSSLYSNGYESECGGRGYVPSRLSECVVAC